MPRLRAWVVIFVVSVMILNSFGRHRPRVLRFASVRLGYGLNQGRAGGFQEVTSRLLPEETPMANSD